jgi:hypothetical protein
VPPAAIHDILSSSGYAFADDPDGAPRHRPAARSSPEVATMLPFRFIATTALLSSVLMVVAAAPATAIGGPETITDPRTRAMGGAGVTTAEGPTATYSNPALVAFQNDYAFATTLPVIVAPANPVSSWREFAAAFPVVDSTVPQVSAGIAYQRFFYDPRSISSTWSFSGGMRIQPWLAAGLAARWIRQTVDPQIFGSDGDGALGWDFGVLAQHAFIERGDRSISGRVAAVFRNWGPELRLGESPASGDPVTLPLSEQIAVGAGLVIADPRARLTLSWEYDEGTSEENRQRMGVNRLYGAELELLGLVALRAGHTDATGQQFQGYLRPPPYNTQGIGLILPFAQRLRGRFDYARLLDGVDLYAMSLAWDPAASKPTTVLGRPVRTRVAFGVAGAVSEPFDVSFDPGPSVQAGVLVDITGDLALENHVGWTWIDTRDPAPEGMRSSVLDFGTGLRYRFDLGRWSPVVSGGVRGYRFGSAIENERHGETVTERQQMVAPGYYMGLGVEHRPQRYEHLAFELVTRLHFARPRPWPEPFTAAELTLAVLFR